VNLEKVYGYVRLILRKSKDMSAEFRENLRTCPVKLEKVYVHVR
jgi:hypothetical protein